MDQATRAGPSSRAAVPDGIPGMLLSALPGGWRIAGRCRFGTGGPVGPASGCHALAHPSIGVALLDVAPDATPNAEARLRRALAAADFWQSFPGTLPVWHGRIEIGAVRSLPGLLAEGFGTLPPLTVPGKEGWIAALGAALAEDPAWMVPGRASRPVTMTPPTDPEEEEAEAAPPRRRRRRWPVMLGGALAAGLVLVLGLALLGEAPERVPPPQVVAAAAPRPAPTPAPPALAAPVEAPRVQAVPSVVPPPALAPIERVTLVAPPPPPVPRAEEPAPVAEPAVAPPQPVAEPLQEEASLALPPPAPPPAPALRRVTAPRIDPGCTRALYRYQQGLALNAAEAAHVRNGCATRR